MHTNSTQTSTGTNTSTSVSTASGTAATARPRLRVLAGGVIAVGALTFGVGAALAAQPSSSVPNVTDDSAIAEFARESGLSGLSPASLAPTATSSTVGSTTHSMANPASTEMADWYADHPAIADWARATGLCGLSPVSLRATAD